jgi:hypothetical protein
MILMAKRKKAASKVIPAGQGAALALPGQLLDDVRALIRTTREGVAQAVNSALVLLYWSIGDRIRRDILKETRASYGEEIVPTLSAQLVADFGQGYSARNLFRMVHFAEVFPDQQIVSTLSRQLGWSFFAEYGQQIRSTVSNELRKGVRWVAGVEHGLACALSEQGREAPA